MDDFRGLFDETKSLILYNIHDLNEIRVMGISDPIEITGKQINDMMYPDSRPENYKYEIFNTQPSYESGSKYNELVKQIVHLNNEAGLKKGTPIFLVN